MRFRTEEGAFAERLQIWDYDSSIDLEITNNTTNRSPAITLLPQKVYAKLGAPAKRQKSKGLIAFPVCVAV